MLDAARLDILPLYGYISERIECSLNNDREENTAEPKRPRVNGTSDRSGSDFSSPTSTSHFRKLVFVKRSAGYPLTNSLIFLIKIYMIEKLTFIFRLFRFYNANFNKESYISYCNRIPHI